MSTQPTLFGRATPRVLVVDDEETICTLLARTILPLGCAVDVAFDACSALDMMRRAPADVVLCDIRMPGFDGVWLIERLQLRHPATAIIIVTGIADLRPTLTLRKGIVGYITKPFAASDVRQIVRQALAAAQMMPPRPLLRVVPPSSARSERARPGGIEDDDR